jgi:hypothetical protein
MCQVTDLLTRAEQNLRAALTVYGPTASPLYHGWTLSGLAFASVACAEKVGCGDPAASRAEAATRFAEAAEAYRTAGYAEQVASMLALAQAFGTVP